MRILTKRKWHTFDEPSQGEEKPKKKRLCHVTGSEGSATCLIKDGKSDRKDKFFVDFATFSGLTSPSKSTIRIDPNYLTRAR